MNENPSVSTRVVSFTSKRSKGFSIFQQLMRVSAHIRYENKVHRLYTLNSHVFSFEKFSPAAKEISNFQVRCLCVCVCVREERNILSVSTMNDEALFIFTHIFHSPGNKNHFISIKFMGLELKVVQLLMSIDNGLKFNYLALTHLFTLSLLILSVLRLDK